MEQKKMFFAALRVAGKFEAADREVGVALYLDGSFQNRSQSGLVAFENKIVRGGNIVKVTFGAENERIVQDSRPLQNRAATGATAEYWNPAKFAKCAVDVV